MARSGPVTRLATTPQVNLPIVVGELTEDGSTLVLVPNEDAVVYLLPYLKLATPLFKPSKPPGAITLAATWPAVVQISYILGKAWQPGPRLREWIAQRFGERTGALDSLVITPPEGCTPRPYQVEGAALIAATGRALLFDEQGTGKTITAILGLVEREAMCPTVRPAVCVVPSSVVDSWVREWQTWAPNWRVVAWRGAPRKRHALAGTADVYVTSYDTARMDASAMDGALVKLGGNAVVVDECHMIKSPFAVRSLAVRRLAKRSRAFVALSGTPITHHPGDLWPTLNAHEHLAWPAGERFEDRYCAKAPTDYGQRVIGLNPHTEPELRACLLGQHRRVAKADVLSQLPPKVYSVRTVELPAAWRKVYDDMETKMLAELPDGGELSTMSVLGLLTRLSQLAASASDVTVTVEDTEDGPVEHVHVKMMAPCWKADALVEILQERPGSPVVAFAPSRQLMMLAGEAATAAGFNVGYVVGGQSAGERTQTVEHFQGGKFDLLCATTGAGGVGLTLTAASTVVFLQRPWSLVEALQAEDRCHRIGSEIHESIEIIDVVAADTVDSRVRVVLHEKAGQLAELLQDTRIVSQLLGGSRVTRKGRA